MSPQPEGRKLEPYEIVSRIGAGGMGEVWRARDPRLNREVAIKVSAQQFTDRFEREARAIAALNHPNICTLFDVGPNYLVMELVEGSTLAERIAQGPIELDEALAIAKQIADALEAAHEKGIVHRDLKPANVKIRPDGSVKVLDFGLAKSAADVEMTSDSPTMLSVAGMILGTAGYMSPEQARGTLVDKRADIWAFGVVLYEMVTGKRLFAGATISDSLASILKEQPDLSLAPEKIRRLLSRCLEKDPRKRLRDISGVELLLEETGGTGESPASRGARPTWWIAIAMVAAIIAASVSFIHFRETPPEAPLIRSAILLPDNTYLFPPAPAVVSPDGRYIVFGGVNAERRPRLYLRPLDSPDARILPGTEDAIYPFWSPDSRSIAFGAQGKLRKIDIGGGPPVPLADAAALRGGTWSKEGVIVFSPGARAAALLKVAATGGATAQVTAADPSGNTKQLWPWFLPDGRHFLYTVFPGGSNLGEIHVGSIDAGGNAATISKIPGTISSQAIYAKGHILFLRDQTLMAEPFDERRLAVTGEAVPVAEQIEVLSVTGRAPFAASTDGILVFQIDRAAMLSLAWSDREGRRTPVPGDPAPMQFATLSPDEKRLALALEAAGNTDIWIQDMATNVRTRLTFDPAADIAPVWSPDSRALAFSSFRHGRADLYRRQLDGAGKDDLLLGEKGNKISSSWSPDGKYLLYRTPNTNGNANVMVLPLEGDAKPIPLAATPFSEAGAVFSPDGHWVAYVSNESGRPEVYLTPFPAGSGGRRQVSAAAGASPFWRGDGSELYFYAGDNTLKAVAIHSTPTSIEVGATQSLFHISSGFVAGVSRNGQRFLVATPQTESAPGADVTLMLTENWTAGLKK